MDKLTSKTFEQYDYTCRYSNVPYYYNTDDNKWIYGIGYNLDTNTTYVAHKVKEIDTLDSLALKYYNNPTYYWVIAYYNNIDDSFINLKDYYDIIKIPSITSIEFKDLR